MFFFFCLINKFADESMAQKPCGDLFLNTPCFNDVDCKAQCVKKGYNVGICQLELPPPRKCGCRKIC